LAILARSFHSVRHPLLRPVWARRRAEDEGLLRRDERDRRRGEADIAAVVSCGGRPDLARPRLAAVTAATLLIVGGRDEVVVDLHRRAQAELRCENHLAVMPGATHLFEEPGALAAAAALARDWFLSPLAHGRNPVA